jgi:hypothetical protein
MGKPAALWADTFAAAAAARDAGRHVDALYELREGLEGALFGLGVPAPNGPLSGWAEALEAARVLPSEGAALLTSLDARTTPALSGLVPAFDRVALDAVAADVATVLGLLSQPRSEPARAAGPPSVGTGSGAERSAVDAYAAAHAVRTSSPAIATQGANVSQYPGYHNPYPPTHGYSPYGQPSAPPPPPPAPGIPVGTALVFLAGAILLAAGAAVFVVSGRSDPAPTPAGAPAVRETVAASAPPASTQSPTAAPTPIEPAPVAEPAPEASGNLGAGYGTITGDRVQVRSSPTTTATAVGSLRRGSVVSVLERAYPEGNQNEAILTGPTTFTYSNSSSVAFTLNSGKAVYVLDEYSDGYRISYKLGTSTGYARVSKSSLRFIEGDPWYKVRTSGGTVGWVFGKYVQQ